MPDAIKNANGQLEVTIQKEAPEAEVKIYDYDFLIQQKANIIKQANDFLSLRQKELDEVIILLGQCEQLGIVAKEMPKPLEEV